MFLKLITCLLPWSLKRILLIKFFNYKIHPNAHIGLAWVFPQELVMEEGAKIDHFTMAIHLDRIIMGNNATIGRSNWITGLSTNVTSLHFKHQIDRKAELIIGESSAITKNHHLDCTNAIHIGRFSTVAGYQSQLLTHSIDVHENRQDSSPIFIGDYTFISTNVVILGGSRLPDYSVLGAKSLLNKHFTQNWTLYGGLPAKALKEIPKDAKYFSRSEGFVY
ncbi:MAG: acyltransferase [Pyrinomonadaceae bacterium]|nr:acyltransferase [Sphingobacteriaceae bacterium]